MTGRRGFTGTESPIASTAPIVVTGPTGWIGAALLSTIAATRGPGWETGVRLFGSSARAVIAPDGTSLPMRALGTIAAADVDGAHVVHLAYLTKEKVALLGERRFTDANLAIDDAVLAALAGARPAAVFVASSGAAALAADGRDRHPYGLGKLRQEDRFLDWAAAAAAPLIAGRIFNIAGPFINKLSSYAIADFAVQARRDARIAIAAPHPVFRSYCHVIDLCRLVLAAGAAGHGEPRPVDLCGAEVVEMADLALAVAQAIGLPAAAITRLPMTYDRAGVYLGDATQTKRLAMRLGVPLRPIAEQIADTIEWIASHEPGRPGL